MWTIYLMVGVSFGPARKVGDMDFNLDDINEVMDFTDYIFANGNKHEGEYPVKGYWMWEDYAIMLLNTGDVILTDQREERTIVIFSSERSLNNPIMAVRGMAVRMYLINEFLSWENLEKLDNFKTN